jgi:hypothetical protein
MPVHAQAVGTAKPVVGPVLPVSLHAMELLAVVRWAFADLSAQVGLEDPLPLAVQLCLVVLRAILHETALALKAGLSPLALVDRLSRLLGWSRVHLFDEVRARLGAVVPFGVILRASP